MSFETFMEYIKEGNIQQLETEFNNLNNVQTFLGRSGKYEYPAKIISDLGGAGREIICTPLHLACAYNRTEVVLWLLRNIDQMRLNDEQRDHIMNDGDTNDLCGRTPLFLAVQNENIDIVQALLDLRRTDVNQNVYVGSRKLSTLYIAAYKGNMRVVDILLNVGANINAPVYHNFTALFAAIDSGNNELISLLINRGANINATANYPNPDLCTSLKYAIHRNNLGAIRILLQHNVNIDRTDLYKIANLNDYPNELIWLRNLLRPVSQLRLQEFLEAPQCIPNNPQQTLPNTNAVIAQTPVTTTMAPITGRVPAHPIMPGAQQQLPVPTPGFFKPAPNNHQAPGNSAQQQAPVALPIASGRVPAHPVMLPEAQQQALAPVPPGGSRP